MGHLTSDLIGVLMKHTDWEIGLVVKEFLVVKLLNKQAPKSNNQKIWLLRLALVLVHPHSGLL